MYVSKAGLERPLPLKQLYESSQSKSKHVIALGFCERPENDFWSFSIGVKMSSVTTQMRKVK